MNTKQKLEVILKRLSLTQTKLADRLGVSFVAFNSWWTGKSIPRDKALNSIEDLYLEVTGQKTISLELLNKKKDILKFKASVHKKVVKEILDNPDIRDQFVLKLTYHSNSIEGSTLTEPDTAAILFDNVALPNKSLNEQLEAKNHQTALNYMFQYVLDNKEVNEAYILKLHSILMNGVRSDAGLYRDHPVRILGVNLPTANYIKVPELIKALMNKSEKYTIENIISKTSKLHSKFEQIHPFSDGNGRIGRLVMNTMLLSTNIAPAVIRQEQKQLYYTYLYKSQTSDDQSQLDNYLYDAVIDGYTILEREDKSNEKDNSRIKKSSKDKSYLKSF